jgi:hypothetical protein
LKNNLTKVLKKSLKKMPKIKEKKIFCKKTRCLTCRKKRLKCESSIEFPNSCIYCLENHLICNRYKPSNIGEEIKRLNSVIYDHESRIRILEYEVKLLKKENQIFKRNLNQRRLLDEAVNSEILLLEPDEDND